MSTITLVAIANDCTKQHCCFIFYDNCKAAGTKNLRLKVMKNNF